MIVCAFPFFNELGLLRLRLEYLSNVVDRFVLVESTVTFSGFCKPLYFQEHKSEFADYLITHVIIDDMPHGHDPWLRAAHQRQRLLESVTSLRPEIVLFMDADEIPRADIVEQFRDLNFPIAIIRQDLLLYHADRLDHKPWISPRVCRFDGRAPDRNRYDYPAIESGWHFAYHGSQGMVLSKLNSVCHSVEPRYRHLWQAIYHGAQPGLERTVDYPREKLPTLVQNDPARYDLTFYSGLGRYADERRERYPSRNPDPQDQTSHHASDSMSP